MKTILTEKEKEQLQKKLEKSESIVAGLQDDMVLWAIMNDLCDRQNLSFAKAAFKQAGLEKSVAPLFDEIACLKGQWKVVEKLIHATITRHNKECTKIEKQLSNG